MKLYIMKNTFYLAFFSLFWTTLTQAQCFVQIASGEQHTMAIADDGTLWGWGSNTSGECGISTIPVQQNLTIPTQVGTFDDWVDVDCGPYHSIALRSNGDVYTMGFNSNGQCGSGNTSTIITPVAVETGAINVAAGKGNTSYLIKGDSTLWACGLNNGRYGDGSNIASTFFVQVSNETNWVDIAGGLNHSIALNSAGQLYTSGDNGQGQLGLGNYTPTSTRTLVNTGGNPPSITSNRSISAGVNYSVYLDNFGQVRTCGSNANGRLGVGNQGVTNLNTFYTLSLQNMNAVKAGYDGCMAWNAGSFYAWGRNQYSIMTTTQDSYAPTLAWYTDSPIDASMGLFNIAVISFEEGVYNWGANDRGNCGDGTTTHRTIPQLNNAQCQVPCSISDVVLLNVSSCDPQTDTYTVQLEIHYENPPATGNLIVYGTPFNVSGSPQQVTLTEIADGQTISSGSFAYFEDDFACQYTFGSLWTAPQSCNTASLTEIEKRIVVYPNPANSILTIDTEESLHVEIQNLCGNSIQEIDLNVGSNTIDISRLAAGVYFIYNSTGQSIKFLKQ